MSGKIIVTAKEIHPILLQGLREKGFNIIQLQAEDRDLLEIEIKDAEGLIFTTYTKVDKKLLDLASNLKFVARVGSGMENVDIAYCHQKNIKVISTPQGLATSVGEHTLALLLNLLHKINFSNQQLKNGVWQREQNRGVELTGKTIGIIGFGNTGQAFAKVLSGFDVSILVYDKYVEVIENKNSPNIKKVSLEELQSHAEVVSFHVPLNSETKYYICKEFIDNCDKKPILINTSRGAIASVYDIIAGLENSKLAGYGVDVYEDEPIFESKNEKIYQKLIAMDNVIATPHIAGWSVESKKRMAEIVLSAIF